MKLEFTEQSPLRLEAFSHHYAKQFRAGRVFQTQAEAEQKARRGEWVCQVSLLGRPLFFTAVRCNSPVVAVGVVLGMWNELTFLKQKS
jgi:hypothetical protein